MISGSELRRGVMIELDGKPVHFASPIDAQGHGIEIVYQNLALSPALSIERAVSRVRTPAASRAASSGRASA